MSGIPELGLGEAEMLCVMTTWKRHMTLRENANKFEKQADQIQIFLYLLGILTTVLAVFYAQEKAAAEEAAALAALEGGERMLSEIPLEVGSGLFAEFGSGATIDPNTQSPLEMTMIMLPILATLVGTIRTNLRPREKWATCLMASNQIVDQIYKFRLRTDKYDTQAPPPVKEGEEPVEISPKMRETFARKDFIDTCTGIYSHAISTEVSKGGALKMGDIAKLQTQHEADQKVFIELLKRHVKGTLYGQKLPPAPSDLKKKPLSSKQAAKELEGKKKQAKKAKEALSKAKNFKKSKQGGMLMKLLSMTPAGKKMAKQAEKMMAQADGAMGAMDKLNGAMDMVSKVGGQVIMHRTCDPLPL